MLSPVAEAVWLDWHMNDGIEPDGPATGPRLHECPMRVTICFSKTFNCSPPVLHQCRHEDLCQTPDASLHSTE